MRNRITDFIVALSVGLCASSLGVLDARAADGPATEVTPQETLRYEIEALEFRGNTRTADSVIRRLVPFKSGDVLAVDDPEIEITRYRLLTAGFFSKVRVSLRRGRERGKAILTIEVVERNTLIIDHIAMGIAADEDKDGQAELLSPYFGLGVAETNLAGRGMRLNAGVAVAADQWAMTTGFADSAIFQSKWSFDTSLYYVDGRDFFGTKDVSFESPLLSQKTVTDYAIVDYKRFGGSIGGGHDLSLLTHLSFGYRLEAVDAVVPVVASHVRGTTREPIRFHVLGGKSVHSSLHAAIRYDSRNRPFLPTAGTVAALRGSLGLTPLGSNYGYQKFEAQYQRWWTLPWAHVISLQSQIGVVHGDAPFFERFYVGDFAEALPGRILGINPDRRQPPNLFNTAIEEVRYGDYAARLLTEYRVELYKGHSSIYGIDLFGRVGLYSVMSHRDLTDAATGYEGPARAPIDLTYNLGLRIETEVGGFSLGFSNLLGLLPARGGDRK